MKKNDNCKKVLALHGSIGKTSPSFRSNQGISKDFLKELLAKGEEYGLNEIEPFSINNIILAQWVSLKCQYGCPQYNTNWCCPPTSPDLEKVRAILDEYSLALLLVGNRHCPDFYSSGAKRRAYQMRYWKGTMSIERQLFLKGYDKAFSLVSGACSLCKECAYPDPCRFPLEKRPPVESFGIDLIGTLKKLGRSTAVSQNTDDSFNHYSMILLE